MRLAWLTLVACVAGPLGAQSVSIETGSAQFPKLLWQDGTVDVDIRTTTRRSFVYLNFRMASELEHEEFYLRPHKSLLPDASQYAPVYKGQSAWQLYFGPRGAVAVGIVPERWQHLRMVVQGARAAFFLGDTLQPFMVCRWRRHHHGESVGARVAGHSGDREWKASTRISSDCLKGS